MTEPDTNEQGASGREVRVPWSLRTKVGFWTAVALSLFCLFVLNDNGRILNYWNPRHFLYFCVTAAGIAITCAVTARAFDRLTAVYRLQSADLRVDHSADVDGLRTQIAELAHALDTALGRQSATLHNQRDIVAAQADLNRCMQEITVFCHRMPEFIDRFVADAHGAARIAAMRELDAARPHPPAAPLPQPQASTGHIPGRRRANGAHHGVELYPVN